MISCIRNILITICIFAYMPSNCFALKCKQNYHTINFNTDHNVSIFACISKDKFMGTQSVAWNVKNNTNDKIEVKFIKVYNLSCGKTERVEVSGFAPILKPGQSEGDGSFADLLRDDIFVNEKCGKNAKINSISIEKLNIINISAKEREDKARRDQVKHENELKEQEYRYITKNRNNNNSFTTSNKTQNPPYDKPGYDGFSNEYKSRNNTDNDRLNKQNQDEIDKVMNEIENKYR